MLSNVNETIATKRNEMLALLKTLTTIQSGTHNKAGVDLVCRTIEKVFENTIFRTRIQPEKDYGDMLVLSSPACRDRDNILLVGHMDTVFPADTHFTWWREENEHVNGPGVIDMKGGLVVGIFALLAIAENALMDGLPVKFIFNSEEEVGSPVSRFMIAEEARKSAMAFVLECGGLQGEVVTGRKGRMGLRLEVSGRAGHAAGPGNKASAILSLAQHIISLETVNDRQPGVSVNVGQIQGGVGPNSVPDHAWAAVDVRFADRDGERWFQEQLDAIVHSRTMRGTSTKVVVVSSRPLMEQSRGNRSLFRVAAAQAEALKIPILEEFRSGVSDANIIAAQGIPVLDGMGPLGDLDHSDREYLIVDSLVERCQLLAMTIIECWRRFQTWGHIFDL